MLGWFQFIAVTLVIFLAGSKLPRHADIIADETGVGRTMIGLALLASITSLPEVVVTVSAMRIGAGDLAVANVLGSNLFNLVVLAVSGSS